MNQLIVLFHVGAKPNKQLRVCLATAYFVWHRLQTLGKQKVLREFSPYVLSLSMFFYFEIGFIFIKNLFRYSTILVGSFLSSLLFLSLHLDPLSSILSPLLPSTKSDKKVESGPLQ